MDRNVQIWNQRAEVLLNGPHATAAEIQRAMRAVQAGGVFGYRFLFPAMRVGKHEVYGHRPLVAYRDAGGEVAVLPDAPLGYLTAYDADKPRLDRAVELWPRMQQRPVLLEALAGEEFPADCLGARALTERLVTRTLTIRLPRGKSKDLSQTTIRGVYVSDMIAHNHDRERDIFQISPGNDPASMWLAYQAHVANQIWNTTRTIPWRTSTWITARPCAPSRSKR